MNRIVRTLARITLQFPQSPDEDMQPASQNQRLYPVTTTSHENK